MPNEEIIIAPSPETTLALPSWWDANGRCSIDLAGTPLQDSDIRAFKGTLTVIFGGWTRETEAKAMVLWQHILDKGWSRERLDKTLYRFFELYQYGNTWSAGAFFKCAPENDLKDNDWYLSQPQESRKNIECWQMPWNECLYRPIGTGEPLPAEFRKVYP